MFSNFPDLALSQTTFCRMSYQKFYFSSFSFLHFMALSCRKLLSSIKVSVKWCSVEPMFYWCINVHVNISCLLHAMFTHICHGSRYCPWELWLCHGLWFFFILVTFAQNRWNNLVLGKDSIDNFSLISSFNLLATLFYTELHYLAIVYWRVALMTTVRNSFTCSSLQLLEQSPTMLIPKGVSWLSVSDSASDRMMDTVHGR